MLLVINCCCFLLSYGLKAILPSARMKRTFTINTTTTASSLIKVSYPTGGLLLLFINIKKFSLISFSVFYCLFLVINSQMMLLESKLYQWKQLWTMVKPMVMLFARERRCLSCPVRYQIWSGAFNLGKPISSQLMCKYIWYLRNWVSEKKSFLATILVLTN